MRCILGIGMILLAMAAGVQAERARVGPATRPAGVDAAEVAKLIERLGAEEYREREAAARSLREIGTAVLAALKEACKHADPEVATRAAALIKELEERNAKPAEQRTVRRTSTVHVIVNGNRRSTKVVVENGRKQVQVVEDKRTVDIREDEGGIVMTVTEGPAEKPEKTEYRAKDAEELKEKWPEAHKVYEKYRKMGEAR